MRVANIGNILSFYKYDSKLSLQGDNYFTNHIGQHAVNAVQQNLIPFQLITTMVLYDFIVVDIASGNDLTNLNIDFRDTATERIYTYTAVDDLSGSLLNCSYYYIKVVNALNQIRFVSEKIYVKEYFTHYFEFSNNNIDLGRVMYQTNYEQRAYFDACEDTPQFNASFEKVITLNGEEKTTSSRQVERRVLKGIFLDSQLSTLERISLHENVTLNERDPFNTTIIKNMDFDSEPLEDERNLCSFIFDVDVLSLAGCGSNTFLLLP